MIRAIYLPDIFFANYPIYKLDSDNMFRAESLPGVEYSFEDLEEDSDWAIYKYENNGSISYGADVSRDKITT